MKKTLITILIFLTFITFTKVNNFAFAVSSQDEIKLLQIQKASNEDKIEELKKALVELNAQKGDVSVQKAKLQKELNSLIGEAKKLSGQIKEVSSNLNETFSEIKETSSTINITKNNINESKNAISYIIRKINEQEEYSIFEFLLMQSKISEFFSSLDNLSKLRDVLVAKVFDLHKVRLNLELEKEDLEEFSEELSEQKENLEEEDKKLSLIKNKVKSEFNTTKQKEEYLKKEYEDKLTEIKKLEKEILDFESKIKFILDENNYIKGKSGILKSPVAKVYVTSLTGPRIHPITKQPSYHSGTDFAIPTGTPIFAVEDGIVEGFGNIDAGCGYKRSLGKWVFIRHNGVGLASTYAHLSSFNVKKGQMVKKGSIIAYSGNTGSSTGPHLHMSLYISKSGDGTNAVEPRLFTSYGCQWIMPLANRQAYLDILDYIQPLTLSNFKYSWNYDVYSK